MVLEKGCLVVGLGGDSNDIRIIIVDYKSCFYVEMVLKCFVNLA